VVRKVLGFEMTIAEWIGTAIMLAVPYLVVGMVWNVMGTGHVVAPGGGRIVSTVASVVSWPALVAAAVCIT
jgi:hypothetical protein